MSKTKSKGELRDHGAKRAGGNAAPRRHDHGESPDSKSKQATGSLASLKKGMERKGSGSMGLSDSSTRASSSRRPSKEIPGSHRDNNRIAGAVRGQFGDNSSRKNSTHSYGTVSDSSPSTQDFNAYPVRGHGNLSRPPSGRKHPNRAKTSTKKNKKAESGWTIASLFGGLCCQPGRQNADSAGYSTSSPLLASQKHPHPQAQAPSPRRSNARM